MFFCLFTEILFPCNDVRYVKYYTNLRYNNFIGLLMLQHFSALTVGELTDNNKSVVHQLLNIIIHKFT